MQKYKANINISAMISKRCLGKISALSLALMASSFIPVNDTYAAQVTNTLGVSIKIVGGCVINSVDNIAFAETDLITIQTPTATGSVGVTCTNGHAYSVGLGAGNGTGATISERKMTRQGGTDTISYSLYQDASHSIAWGVTIGGSGNVASGTGDGQLQNITVYGKVIAPTTAPAAGDYSDVVAVTVTY